MQDQDRMSEASFGSTISLHSIGSDGGFSPKPPGSRKLKKSRTAKVKNQQDSPYGSRKTAQSNKKTGRELWVNSIRQGVGMSNESSGMSTWNGIKSPYSNQSKAMASTSSYLLDQLLMSTGRAPKNHTRTASYSSARVGGNGPAYKTAEEYYDDIVELKKRINSLMRENELIQSKMHKVEEDNITKGRQIEELINPNMTDNHLRRTLTDKKKDSSAVVNSLKHKLHSVERVVKSKDSELSKLKNDLKYTEIVELQLQIEMYHEEVQRLNLLLTEPQGSNALQITSDIKREKTTEGKLKKYNEAVQALSEDNARLLLENNTLKQDLRKAMELNANSLNLSKDVEDMNRTELLAKIASLEQQLKEEETKEVETPRMRKPSSQKKKYPGKAGEEIQQLEEKEHELLEELEKQKDVIKKLKEDRTHYRKLADEYRTELDKYKQTGPPPEKTTTEETTRQRSNSAASTQSSRKSSKKESRDSEKKTSKSADKESHAATTIQRNWRKHRQNKAQVERASYDEAVLSIQAAFRGHRSRNQLLQKHHYDDYDDYNDYDDYVNHDDVNRLDEDDVILMQAAFRGHKVRQALLRKEESLTPYNRYDDDDGDNDDIAEPPRFRRSFDTGEPMAVREMPVQSSRGKQSYSRSSISNSRNQKSSSSSRDSRYSQPRDYHNQRGYTDPNDDDTDDDDDDDDVVIGSSSSLNSTDRFEQSYLARNRSDTADSRYGQSRMPIIKERSEASSSGKASLNKLQRNSISWDGMRNSNINDFLSDSDDEEAVITSKKSHIKKKDKIKKNSLETSISKIQDKSKRKESTILADKWASSGKQNSSNSKKQEKPLISSRLSASRSPWKQVSQDDDDDDDDLVVSPAVSRKPLKKELEDELY